VKHFCNARNIIPYV
jgi:hypothetical protein